MQQARHNPLVPAVLQVLRTTRRSLAIHELLHEIKQFAHIPSLDDDVQMALFKLNWLMMNALYQLQHELLAEGYYLVISTLDIRLQPLSASGGTNIGQQLKVEALRDYYLDWKHFSDTTREEVQALLDGVWQSYTGSDEQARACRVLGLEVDASAQRIRSSYRKLAGEHHPDKGGDPLRFMEIRQAYEVLKKARC